jgi:NhaP-type Na+/H+ or K+/H+ antiporter
VDPDTGLYLGVGVVALLVAGYGLLAALLARHSASAAFCFVVLGVVLGGKGLGLVPDMETDPSVLSLLAELTLSLVLFAAASTVDLRRLEGDGGPVLRLLGIGLPLSIVAGTLLALGLFPGISIGLAVLIATILAPTDADLGQPVIHDQAVPARIRRILNLESGLNDGVAAPIITFAIAWAIVGDLSASEPLSAAVLDLLLAAIVGTALGLAGGWLLVRASARGLTSRGAEGLAVLALAVGAYALVAGLGASGFVAAFCAGIGYGVGSGHKAERAVVFTEAEATLLSIIVWLVFGFAVIGRLGLVFDPAVIIFALAALTVMRMLPVAVALIGERFDLGTVAFVGWFGPRGLASIVFTLLAMEALDSAAVSSGPLVPAVAWTIVLSVVLHGFSARPLAIRYGRRVSRLPADSPEFLGDREPRRKGALWSPHHSGSSEPPSAPGAPSPAAQP